MVPYFSGNIYSNNNKPKREVFKGNVPDHLNEYRPFQYNDGQFGQQFPPVKQQQHQPHKTRHHHQNEGRVQKYILNKPQLKISSNNHFLNFF